MKVERREITERLVGASRHGKSTEFIKCPFCGEYVEVYIWSFRGSGKLCPCGARLSHMHGATKEGQE